MKRSVTCFLVAIIVTAAAGCEILLGIEDVTDGKPDGAVIDAPVVNQQYRKTITIDASRVEAPLEEQHLRDFPVLISLEDADLAARARPTGDDIHFTGDDGVGLAHELERWEPDSGRLIAWVKIPTLSSTTDTAIYLYYGDVEAAKPADPSAVWSNGFVSVWHLSEDPAVAVHDSTEGSHGTARGGMSSDDVVPAQIGDGLDFDGVDDEITFANPLMASSPHTISAWVNQRMATAGESMLMALGNGAYNEARWIKTSDWNGRLGIGFYSNDWNLETDIRGSGWRLLHWTFEAPTNWIYVDGERTGPATLNQVNTRGDEGIIGNARAPFGEQMNLDGQIDEVRISNVARTAAWIATEWHNQSAPSSFYTVGDEQALP